MSRRKMKHRGIIALVIIIVLALLIYGLVPTILNTNPSSMKNGNSYYVAGMVTTDITYNGHSAFTLDDHGNTITVLYNGTASINTYVLVHGTYNGRLVI
jgi:cytochrome c-type biogenesis protein CcmE